MLDENLPTFQFRTSSDDPLSSVLYFSQNGSDPAPEYVFRRADPSTNPRPLYWKSFDATRLKLLLNRVGRGGPGGAYNHPCARFHQGQDGIGTSYLTRIFEPRFLPSNG